MKTFSITIAALISILQLHAQSSDVLETKDKPVKIRMTGVTSGLQGPLYIITVDNRKLKLPSARNAADSLELAATLDQISADWIQSVAVLKKKEATDRYGPQGEHGVILMELKNGIIDMMPAELGQRFKVE